MKRVATYARVSTSEQATEGYSLDAQTEKARLYADLKDWEVVEEFTDAGASGAKSFADRPGGQYVLEAAEAGTFDVLVMTKLDRFARSVMKALQDYETLEGFGVEVVFVEDSIDTTTPQGRVFRNMLLTFAEFEREQIRDRNMAGRFAKASAGAGWAIGRIPFGFKSDEETGHLIANPDEARTVELVFQLRADGMSLRDIATRLNETGHAPRPQKGEARTFTAGSISHYLKATYYRGDPIVRELAPAGGAERVEFTFPVPALVHPDLWDRANRRGTHAPARRKEQRTYALGSRIYHAHADGTVATMFGQARRQGGRWLRVYRCTASRSGGCDGVGIDEYGTVLTATQADYLEAKVLKWLLENDLLADPDGRLGSAAEDTLFIYDAYDRHDPLPEWVIELLSEAVAENDVTTVLYRKEDPKRPGLRLETSLGKTTLDSPL